jgi:very-short-patch-repair endonuclease
MFRTRPAIGSTEQARRLRRDAIDAGRRMRRILRECFPEARFRFQVPLLTYTADFCSHRARIVIEVDGGQHDPVRDERRTRAVEAEGYRILRFWNHDVLGNPDGVATLIHLALHGRHPHPALPHQGGGGRGAHPCPV